MSDFFKDDRQNNTWVSAKLISLFGRLGVINVAYSMEAVIRIGANFLTTSAAWQMVFL